MTHPDVSQISRNSDPGRTAELFHSFCPAFAHSCWFRHTSSRSRREDPRGTQLVNGSPAEYSSPAHHRHTRPGPADASTVATPLKAARPHRTAIAGMIPANEYAQSELQCLLAACCLRHGPCLQPAIKRRKLRETRLRRNMHAGKQGEFRHMEKAA